MEYFIPCTYSMEKGAPNMSTNVSKEKREKLVEKIKAIKTYIATAKQDENTAQLLTYIAEIEKDIKGKKYGLVFEEHRESIDETLENNLPVLVEDESLFIDNGGQMNFLIEGDNLASLKLLEKTHKGKIDLIYIDPPYNTGNKDFIYDDSFVDNNDLFNHSKWLSFMNNRLSLAKNLLSPTGFIFISIGDEEQSTLKMLCDEIFGISNHIACCTRVAKRTSNKGTFFKPTKDYVLVYAKNISNINWKFGAGNKIDLKDFKYEDEKGRYKKNGASLYQPSLDSRPNQRYYIECPDGSFIIPPGTVFPETIEDGAFVRPLSNQDKCWRWSRDTYLQNKDKLIFTKASSTCPLIDSNGNPSKWNIYDKVYLSKKEGESLLPEDVIYDFVNSQGTKEILDLNINFSFAKPSALVKYLIEISKISKSATILDFFAGSGTTGHAVMKLNAEDGGQRKFILCTNNENNICREVTYERIKRVIDKEDYKASLKYFKVDFVPISDKLYYEYADELLKHVKELVELENAINFNGNDKIAIILTEEELDIFANAIPETCKTVYLGHDVLPSETQEKIFKKNGITINVIPDYYYRDLEA